RRAGVGGLRVRRRTARPGARRPRSPARTALVLLEERQVGARRGTARPRRTGILGDLRLSHVRRPMEGTAVQRRLTWQIATVNGTIDETPTVRTIQLAVPDWPGHRAGQHLDVRLTAEDGYTAERSYSIASAPGELVAITVERLKDGEVSPYLTEEL